MKSTARLHSLGFGRAETYLAAAAFVAGNIILPQACHLVPDGGRILLPIYFFTLLGACRYGWRVGLLTALFSPLVNTLLFGMPAAGALPAILVKSVLLALAASYAVGRFGRAPLAAIASAVLAAQIAGSAFEWLFTGSFDAAMQDFRMGLPGMALQTFGVWAIVKYLIRK